MHRRQVLRDVPGIVPRVRSLYDREVTIPAISPPLGLFDGHDHPRLYDHAVRVFRGRHYSPRTQKAYLHWIGQFLRFHDGRHPRSLREEAVNAFLSDLALTYNVSASTQNQALAALLFLYRHVLEQPLEHVDGIVRATRPKRLPVVLTREEVGLLLREIFGAPRLVCMTLYGTGMRLTEGLSVRVKDLDFGRGEILVREGKGAKDRVTMLPAVIRRPLAEHLETVRRQHEADLARGRGRAPMPSALRRKYVNADREWGWQWVFPATSHYRDRVTGIAHRYHLHESVVQKAVRGRRWRRDSPSASPRTPSATRSRRICWRTVTTSAPSRSF